MSWKPNPEQQQSLDEHGYCILPRLIPHDTAMMIRGVILDHVLKPETGAAGEDEADPMDPMGTSPEALAARLRKLNGLSPKSPVIWHHFNAAESVLEVARHFVGDDIVMKFESCFMKPAKTGSATPWHQDNGLWRDGDTESLNLWMAIDPATKANGCLQFIPGSHRGKILPHPQYEGMIHGELPRDTVAETIEKQGVHHIELEPGSAVCWHSNLWHYSPPNTSDHGRIAVAAVYSAAKLAAQNPYFRTQYQVMKNDQRLADFPPRPFEDFVVEKKELPPFPAAV